MHTMKVAILLATYNGEVYLKEQLDSIIRQTYQNFTIYVRDDESTDRTLEIINEYTRKYPDKIYIIDNGTKKLGAAKSFMKLLEIIDSDYYMFCDQDDVWLPDKIELTLNKMQQVELCNPNLPITIHTDLHVVGESLELTQVSFWESMKLNPCILQQVNYISVCNCVTGCTMMINKIARVFSLPMPDDAPMHDHWIAYICAYNGIIDNLSNQTILYRQHSNNTVGAKKVSLGNTLKKIIRIYKYIPKYYMTAAFFKKYGYGSITKWFIHKILYLIRR